MPNNGWTGERHAVRRAWDADVVAFAHARAAAGRPLIWCGDLNVAHTAHDSTDEVFFRAEVGCGL